MGKTQLYYYLLCLISCWNRQHDVDCSPRHGVACVTVLNEYKVIHRRI